jgi:hypothetical protein
MKTIIKNSQDFKDYLSKHSWVPVPLKYPCLVVGIWYDDPDGPADYVYEYVYLKEVGDQYIIDDSEID